jgi:hypothetical protein
MGFNYWQQREISLYSEASKPVAKPTRQLIQWVSGDISLGVKGAWREASTHPFSVDINLLPLAL